MNKIYDVTIGRKVWVSRSPLIPSDVRLWRGKPRAEDGCYWIEGNKSKWLVDVCSAAFCRHTGLTIKPGECYGPVYIGIVDIPGETESIGGTL